MISLLPQIALPLLGTYNLSPVLIRDKPLWFAVSVTQGGLEIDIELDCGEKIGTNQALLQFQFDDDTIDYSSYGLTKSHREEVGYYTYLQTQSGRHKQHISLIVPYGQGLLLIGIRTWGSTDTINLLELTAPASSESSLCNTKVDILLSVDVEALPGRSPDSPVDRLIWGGAHSEEGHGVGRLAKIFNEHGVKATFYVDFASCCLHGDQGISEAAQYLVAKGQDVQLHVHSEVLLRHQQWVHATHEIPTFALHSFSTAKRAIEYSTEKYFNSLGKKPDIFRAGGLWWNTDSVLATGAAGIPCASNVSPTREFAPSSNVFKWENGVIELPIDFCLDPYIQNGCDSLLSDVMGILENKTHKVVSCYLHSWSLSPRTSDGYHLEHSFLQQKNLEEAIRLLKTLGSMRTSSSEYLNKVRNEKQILIVPLSWKEKSLNVKEKPTALLSEHCYCNICGTTLIKKKLKNDVCPYCHLRTRHRILRSVLDRQLGDIFIRKKVIANHADPNEVNAFFCNTESVMNFDIRPLEYLDGIADVQDLSLFEDKSFDVFYSIYVLSHVTDDRKAISEMRRIISDDGVAVIMVPFRINQKTQIHTDITQNYGKDALEKYGVGSYRYYGCIDFLQILRDFFVVDIRYGVDPFTNQQDAVFICRNY